VPDQSARALLDFDDGLCTAKCSAQLKLVTSLERFEKPLIQRSIRRSDDLCCCLPVADLRLALASAFARNFLATKAVNPPAEVAPTASSAAVLMHAGHIRFSWCLLLDAGSHIRRTSRGQIATANKLLRWLE
jgi:hypothetical protein